MSGAGVGSLPGGMLVSKILAKIWETYVASWKAEALAEKRRLVEASVSSQCRYTDPLTQTQGWDQLLDYMRDFHRQLPGGHFVTKRFIAHHDRSVAFWDMCDADGTVIGDGISYGEYDAAGKLTVMTGFFDPVN